MKGKLTPYYKLNLKGKEGEYEKELADFKRYYTYKGEEQSYIRMGIFQHLGRDGCYYRHISNWCQRH